MDMHTVNNLNWYTDTRMRCCLLMRVGLISISGNPIILSLKEKRIFLHSHTPMAKEVN